MNRRKVRGVANERTPGVTAGMSFRRALDFSPPLLIAALWAFLYLPHIPAAGLVRDELGFLPAWQGSERFIGWIDEPRSFETYFEYQAWVSSMSHIQWRPVSGVLHGLCYWFFGATPWPYHLINLSLFLASVLFIYVALANVLPRSTAILTAAFALVYATAGATVFSSVMMNSNLAALTWSGALYLDSRASPPSRSRNLAVVVLLLLSSLSYEVFIPLFLANAMLRVWRDHWPPWPGLGRLLGSTWPVLLALVLFVAYRVAIAPLVFAGGQPAIEPSLTLATLRYLESIVLGLQEYFVKGFTVSLSSLPNVGALPGVALASIIALLACLAILVRASSAHLARQSTARTPGAVGETGWRRPAPPWLGQLAVVAVLFLAAHMIFAVSDYIPRSTGFETRTQGAMRFVVALLLGLIATGIYAAVRGRVTRQLISVLTFGLAAFLALSNVGQREAWIAAARYNDVLLVKMEGAIRSAGLLEQSRFTFIADLPERFPGQVNGEPIFGETWDIGPALSLAFPNSAIRANVYDVPGTIVLADMAIFHGYWEAPYPFYFYRFNDNQIYTVASSADLSRLIDMGEAGAGLAPGAAEVFGSSL